MPCSHLPPADLPDPLRVEDAHLTETVQLLARGIAADLGFDRLPILADALEDAGCDNFALLSHLRSDEPHRVDCWALRRLLRTTLMLPGSVPITFAYCPPGTFLMGSPETEERRSDDELQHKVRLTKGFHCGVYPVTHAQWRAVMGTDPRMVKGDARPVERVGWDEAEEFCARTRELTGQPVRLPTEAEWEYACRGGTTTPFYWGSVLNGTQANCDGAFPYGTDESGPLLGETSDVGCFSELFPHPWVLADVHGNVPEWCADWYDPAFYSRSPAVDPICQDGPVEERVIRGGGCCNHAWVCRAACRGSHDPTFPIMAPGFRVVFTA